MFFDIIIFAGSRFALAFILFIAAALRAAAKKIVHERGKGKSERKRREKKVYERKIYEKKICEKKNYEKYGEREARAGEKSGF